MRSERLVELSDGTSLWTSVEGSGPPVVLCHGGPGLWDYLDGLAALLSGTFTVHRWDQRGCGRSGPSPAYGIDVALADVQRLKSAWPVIGPWAVVGHSWGAHLALLTAIAHPESTAAVVYLSGTGLPSWWRAVGSAAYRTERARRMGPAASDRLARLTERRRTRPEEVEFRTLSWIADFAGRDAANPALERMANSPHHINWELNRSLRAEHPVEDRLLDALDGCTVPCLVLHGGEDPRPGDGARLLAERLPDARFQLIDGAGHLPWVERPEEVAAAVATFLDDGR